MRRLALLLLFPVAALAAEPIAVSEMGGDSIALHDDQGTCPKDTKRAVYTVRPPHNQVINGCYVVVDDHVVMGFEDGDRGAVRVDMFKWARGKKPVTM